MTVRVHAVGRAEVPAVEMPNRFRQDITLFATPPGVQDAPEKLPDLEYWVRRDEVRAWLEDGVLTIVSPLASDARTEIELTEEQERWLEWMARHDVQHVRLQPV